MGDFRMPSLGADMEAGTLVEWHVKPGARVKRGDVVALVETQKGIVEVEIWESGVIDRLLVAPGTKVPVGTVLATMRAEETRAAPAASPGSGAKRSRRSLGSRADGAEGSPGDRLRRHSTDGSGSDVRQRCSDDAGNRGPESRARVPCRTPARS